MSFAVLLLIAAFVIFVVAAYISRSLVAAGLACWSLSVLIVQVHPGGLSMVTVAAVIPLAASAPAAAISQADFITLVTIAVAAFAPVGLKLLPASWKGQGMALVALAVSAALGLADLWATGQLSHFDPATAGLTLAAYIGATQGIYALFKDPWKLADPPAASPPSLKPVP